MLEWVKNHPILSAGGAALAVVIFLLISRGSGGGGYSGQASATGDGNAQNDVTTQVQQQLALAGIAQAGQAQQIAGTIELEKIRGQNQLSLAGIASNVALAQTSAAQQVQTTHDTLSAHVAESQIAGDVQKTQINTGGQVAITQAITSALVQQSQISANAIAEASKRDCGWVGKIFGC